MNVMVLSHLSYSRPLVMNFYRFVASCGYCFKKFFLFIPYEGRWNLAILVCEILPRSKPPWLYWLTNVDGVHSGDVGWYKIIQLEIQGQGFG
jgi:hypothetical protein